MIVKIHPTNLFQKFVTINISVAKSKFHDFVSYLEFAKY